MRRRWPKPTIALVAAALAALALVACGGGSGADSQASSSQASSGQTSTGPSGGSSGRKGSTEKGQTGGSGEPGSPSSPAEVAPVHVSGGGSGQFRTRGGDNSIQNFGEESDESELEVATHALYGFFAARAEDNWPAACSYLARTTRRQLEQLAARSPKLKGKGCVGTLAALTAPLPSAERRESTVVDAGSLRSKGEQAFLIYYGAKRTPYAIPMKRERSEWKVAALAPVPLD